MAKSSFPGHVGVVLAVFEEAHNLRLENLALRTILRRQGLSEATIRRRVNAYKKVKSEEDLSLDRLRQCCEEMIKRLPEIDLEESLASLPLKGPLQ